MDVPSGKKGVRAEALINLLIRQGIICKQEHLENVGAARASMGHTKWGNTDQQ
jgi:hypothetical protein